MTEYVMVAESYSHTRELLNFIDTYGCKLDTHLVSALPPDLGQCRTKGGASPNGHFPAQALLKAGIMHSVILAVLEMKLNAATLPPTLT